MITNMPPGIPAYGTPEHAALMAQGRHPGVQTALAWLAFSHLPEPLQTISQPAYRAALELIGRIPGDSAELTTALDTLVEAKDWFMRAGIRSDQGKPGPVPRPATIVDPPRLDAAEDGTQDQRMASSNPIDNRIGPNFGRPIKDRPQA
jgi:hypothetical protein